MRGWTVGARNSFWFLPAVLGIAAVILAEVAVVVDRNVGILPFFDALSASGGRSILSTVGTSMLTVAGTSFSITVSVLATTSSTYGPRLVRNFMADRSNQFVLAMFTSTFLYCLVVLRSVRTEMEDRDAFVPTLGVHVAVLLAIVDVGVLVYFIHHIATAVQITTLQKQVQTDLVRAVDRTHPARLEAGWTRDPIGAVEGARVTTLKDGYVQHVDLDDLLRIASRDDLLIDVRAMPGDHLVAGDALVVVAGDPTRVGSAALERAVRRTFMVGVARTPEQDLRFALQQLIEIAVRGLASGTSDPYTAVSALDLSRTALIPLVAREAPPCGRLDDQGRPRVRFVWPDASELVGEVMDGVRQYGLANPVVVRSALDLADRLAAAAAATGRDVIRAELAKKVRELLDGYASAVPTGPDLDLILAKGRGILDRLDDARTRG